MSGQAPRSLDQVIESFIESVPPRIRYYGMGGDVEIPTSAELALLHFLRTSVPQSRGDLAPAYERLDLNRATLLATFSVRMATYAVRTNDASILSAGALALVMDNDLLDSRDVLIVLSVLEHSALQLGADFGAVIRDALKVATIRRSSTFVGYLERPRGMRGIEVMGVEAMGSGNAFRYKSKPW